jgi:predicted GIY-YIG superfamily endonuclease
LLGRWVVYILECADGTLYTGITNHLDARLKKHNAGTGAKYTRSRLPVVVRYYESVTDRSSALKLEAAIKRKSRAQKLAMIED